MSTFPNRSGRGGYLAFAAQQAARGNLAPAVAAASPSRAPSATREPQAPAKPRRPRAKAPTVEASAHQTPDALTLTLPVPPSANRYWRKTRAGNTYVGEDAKAYRETVARACDLAGVRPWKCDVVLAVRWYRFRREGDLSNRIKVLEDALIGRAFDDDKQVQQIHAARYDDKHNPRVEVVVSPAAPRHPDGRLP